MFTFEYITEKMLQYACHSMVVEASKSAKEWWNNLTDSERMKVSKSLGFSNPKQKKRFANLSDAEAVELEAYIGKHSGKIV